MSASATTVEADVHDPDENGKVNPSVVPVLDDQEDVVNPWEVKAGSSSGVDYDKIIGELRTKHVFAR